MDNLVTVESLNHDGQGVAHVNGKTVFIDGALPYEKVYYTPYQKKPNVDKANIKQLVKESFIRTTPRCAHFGVCGGCSLQHVDSVAQVAIKQRLLEDNLIRIGKTKPEYLLPPIYGPSWAYRHRARISVRYVRKKEIVLVGFHEKRSSLIADMQSCDILPSHVSHLLRPLRTLIRALSIFEQVPQIEVAVGEQVTVLVLRMLAPLQADDENQLRQFADQYKIQWWLQPNQPDTAYPFYPLTTSPLYYTLPQFDLVFPFKPTEFTQVNPLVNQAMVKRALDLLDPQPHERIADMFCGLGNFTLPIASNGAKVIGIDGSLALITRARENAAHNHLSHLADFQVANLFEISADSLAQLGYVDKMLIDPPRDGACTLIRALNTNAPKRIIYVSCNPATLARDAGILVHEKGYALKAAGIINMFPQTNHVESIAWFEKGQHE